MHLCFVQLAYPMSPQHCICGVRTDMGNVEAWNMKILFSGIFQYQLCFIGTLFHGINWILPDSEGNGWLMVFISSVFMTDFYLFSCEWCQLHFIYLKMNADFPKQPGKKANGFLRPRSQKWYPFCLCLMSSIALFPYLNWLHRYDHLYICMFLEKIAA